MRAKRTKLAADLIERFPGLYHPGKTRKGDDNKATLLDQALAETSPRGIPAEDERIRQEYELARAFIAGHVLAVSIKHVLGKKNDRRFMVTPWLGRVFVGAVKTGLIK